MTDEKRGRSPGAGRSRGARARGRERRRPGQRRGRGQRAVRQRGDRAGQLTDLAQLHGVVASGGHDGRPAALPEPDDRHPRAPTHEPPASAPATLAPRLAEGIEMIGEYEGSGFKETPYIARRADGQTLQLTGLLYSVASHADGRRDFAAIAAAVSEDFGRKVSADNVRFLVEKKLRPLGVLAAADGSSPELERPDPLLALKFRTAVIPERFTRALTTLFRPLFWPPRAGSR